MAGSTFGNIFKITTWDSPNSLPRVRRMTPLRFYPAYLREKQPELQSHLLYIIKTSSPRITVKLHPIIVLDMLITPLI